MRVEIDTYLFCKENIRVSPEFDVFHTGNGEDVGTNGDSISPFSELN